MIGGMAANRATLRRSFKERPDLCFERRTQTVLLDLHTGGGVAAELGQWLGTWTEKQGCGVTGMSRGGSYCAQWRRQPCGAWLINAEVFVLERIDSTAVANKQENKQEPRLPAPNL